MFRKITNCLSKIKMEKECQKVREVCGKIKTIYNREQRATFTKNVLTCADCGKPLLPKQKTRKKTWFFNKKREIIEITTKTSEKTQTTEYKENRELESRGKRATFAKNVYTRANWEKPLLQMQKCSIRTCSLNKKRKTKEITTKSYEKTQDAEKSENTETTEYKENRELESREKRATFAKNVFTRANWEKPLLQMQKLSIRTCSLNKKRKTKEITTKSNEKTQDAEKSESTETTEYKPPQVVEKSENVGNTERFEQTKKENTEETVKKTEAKRKRVQFAENLCTYYYYSIPIQNSEYEEKQNRARLARHPRLRGWLRYLKCTRKRKLVETHTEEEKKQIENIESSEETKDEVNSESSENDEYEDCLENIEKSEEEKWRTEKENADETMIETHTEEKPNQTLFGWIVCAFHEMSKQIGMKLNICQIKSENHEEIREISEETENEVYSFGGRLPSSE
ncbi:probable inactive protein kinase DDB_G0270444 [Xenopus laevis]|uniref:Probable inactive protein kinase DDB_G0270444 n=1 Tax=Xenopus laevis TaxID=8355 RepID=A0A8J1MCK0_XENLA|nr:probable inactive protein kinase DDB_G0270444 [Xenopus laevis]